MAITKTQDGFEKEADEIIQGSMPFGFSPSSLANAADEGISTYAIAAANALQAIPGLTDQKIKFVEIHSLSTNTDKIYVTDPQGVALINHVKGGREIEPGKSVAYPLRGHEEGGRPFIWSPTILQLFTVTRGY